MEAEMANEVDLVVKGGKIVIPDAAFSRAITIERGKIVAIADEKISLERLVEVCCSNPARIFGLHPKKGILTIGSDADLVVVDLERSPGHRRCDCGHNSALSLRGFQIL
jgi:dihydroorotase-like cyclic amidohydrolase